jgi:hypothetical protein
MFFLLSYPKVIFRVILHFFLQLAVLFIAQRDVEFRTTFVNQLSEHVTIDSYGTVLNNKQWPKGREQDKLWVSER